jgi:hypothetical protein
MCTILAFNNWANAQRDTVFFDIPELKVNNSYFLYDLDTMLLKFCYHCEENLVYVINIEQKREYIYLLNIKKTPLKYAKRNAKGFFKMDNTYFFVNGILPENPKKLFIRTDNHQQFYYVERVLLPDDFVIDIVEDCCSIMLEYRYEKLLFGDCK